MAVRTNDNQNQSAQAQMQANANAQPRFDNTVDPQTNPNNQDQTNAMAGAFGMDNNQPVEITDWLSIGMPYHINVSPNGLALTQFQKSMQEYWDNNLSPELTVEMLPVDRQSQSNLAVSVLIIAVRPSKDDKAPVAYHALLIESSVEPFPPKYENVNGRQVEVLQLTSDAYDYTMQQVLAKVVAARYPQASAHISADAEVIPRGYDLTNEQNIRMTTGNAIIACGAALAYTNQNFKDLNLDRIHKGRSKLSETVRFGKNVEIDQAGVPVRADIIMQTDASPINQSQNTFTVPESRTITRSTGYIDLLYMDASQNYGPMPWSTPNAWGGQTPVYQANLVLTSLVNYKMQTTAGILQALVNTSFIRENNLWVQALMPNPNVKNDMHDIGNIGYDISIRRDQKYEKINTSPDQFNPAFMGALIQQWFYPGIAISLDIPVCGASSWYLKVFAEAATGKANARKHIQESADILTNGAFSKIYASIGGQGHFVTAPDNIIFLGYYESKEGRRDIRDLDYLAVCGMLGKRDRGDIATYTDSYNSGYALSSRLHHRRALIQSCLNNVTFTGHAVRVNFEAEFIKALLMAVAECGYHVQPQQQFNDVNYQRGTATWINGSVLTGDSSGIFRSMNNVGGGSMFSTRFSMNNYRSI